MNGLRGGNYERIEIEGNSRSLDVIRGNGDVTRMTLFLCAFLILFAGASEYHTASQVRSVA